MKNLARGFLSVALLACSGTSIGAPLYYTFSGEVVSIGDNGGLVSTFGIQVGQPITYVFEIDYDRPTTYLSNSGQLTIGVDTPATDYFYVGLVSTGYIDEINGGSHHKPGDLKEFHEAFDMLNLGGGTALSTGSDDHWVSLIGSTGLGGSFISQWTVGQYVAIHEMAYNDLNQLSLFKSYAYLNGISASNPLTTVSEPHSLLLVGLGVLAAAAAAAAHKRRRSSCQCDWPHLSMLTI